MRTAMDLSTASVNHRVLGGQSRADRWFVDGQGISEPHKIRTSSTTLPEPKG
jgi:hypothetical protein